VDQIKDLGQWREFGARLRRIRERRHLSLRDCSQAIGLSAEDLINVEVGNIFAFIHGAQLDTKVMTAYEQFLKSGAKQTASANDPNFQLIVAKSTTAADSSITAFLKTQ
jgi:transcriptional regulator with XRE-family HTH domain